jgi:tetraacyldisaccharide 4'-kinase
MPYGKLRENRDNRKRADIILISKTPEEIFRSEMRKITDELKSHPGQKLYFTRICYNDLIPLFENKAPQRSIFPGTDPENYGVVLITGIAVPDSLFMFLSKKFKEIIHLDFPDHHYFNENDVKKIITAWKDLKSQEKILITTEKDAVRLREFANIEDSLKRGFYYIPIGISFLEDDNQGFDNLIFDYVRKNK